MRHLGSSQVLLFYFFCLFSGVSVAGDWTLQATTAGIGFEGKSLQEKMSDDRIPVCTIKSDSDTTALLVGRFRYETDAWVAKKALETELDEQFTLRLVGSDAEIRTDLFTELASLPRPVFEKGVSKAGQLATQSLQGDPIYDRLQRLDTADTREAYKRALIAELPILAESNPVRGYISANLGICSIIDKDYEQALAYLLPVANGEVPSAAQHRVMAMNRAAWVLHWKKDRLTAYRAYREVQDFSELQQTRNRCEVECIGLMLELAECGKGNHADVREEISKALSQISENDVANRATIELMEMETYARQPEPDNKVAAELGEAYIAKYEAMGEKAPQRELASAIFQTGFFHMRAGNNKAARRCFDKVMKDFPEGVDQFFGIDPRAQALNGYSNLALIEGDRETADRITRDILDLYPDTNLARRIEKEIPDIKTRIHPSSEALTEGDVRE